MIPVPAVKKLVSSVSVTVVERDVRSESVCATSVTLRSMATPLENSTVAKNINSISGAMTASSTAATARQSATKAAVDRFARSQIDDIRFIFIALLTDKGEEHKERVRS